MYLFDKEMTILSLSSVEEAFVVFKMAASYSSKHALAPMLLIAIPLPLYTKSSAARTSKRLFTYTHTHTNKMKRPFHKVRHNFMIFSDFFAHTLCPLLAPPEKPPTTSEWGSIAVLLAKGGFATPPTDIPTKTTDRGSIESWQVDSSTAAQQRRRVVEGGKGARA